MRGRWRLFLPVAVISVILDQATKALVNATIPLDFGEIKVIPGFFSLINIRNRGAAFGFLNRSDIDWQFWLFFAATAIAAWAIWSMVRKSGHAPVLWTGLAMVFGGAIGNLIDRIKERAVTDFLDVYIGTSHWPAFNVADTFICIGGGLTLLALILGHDKRPSRQGQ